MRKHLIFAAAFAVILAAAGPAKAIDAGQLELGGGAGFSVPMNDNLDEYDNAFYLAGHGFYQLDRALAIGAELGYAFGHEWDRGGVESELNVLHLTPQVRWSTQRSSRDRAFSPYLIGGVGLYQTQSEVTVNAGPFTAESDNDESDLGFNIGGGINFETARSFVVGADVRYHQIFNSGQDSKFLIPTVRVSFFY